MMGFKKLEYARSWENSADFPTLEENEAKVRADLQYHPNVIRDHINEMVDGLNELNVEGLLGPDDVGVPDGVAALGPDGKVPEDQLPGSYIGMESFNGRSGKVVPQKGDYTDAEVLISPAAAHGLGLADGAPLLDAMAKLGSAAFLRKVPKYTQVSLRDYAEGAKVKIPTSAGEAQEFIVAKHDYEPDLNGEGRVLLVSATSVLSTVRWGSDVPYAGSGVDNVLTTSYEPSLDPDIREAIGETLIRVTESGVVVGPLSRKVFALSVSELGLTHLNANVEGESLPTAADLRDIDRIYWTRTIFNNGERKVFRVSAAGAATSYSIDSMSNVEAYVRAAFTLPSDIYMDDTGVIRGKQEYEYRVTDATGHVRGPNVASGTYAGTGTVRTRANPFTLELEFTPKFVMVYPISGMGCLTGYYYEWSTEEGSDNYYDYPSYTVIAAYGARQASRYSSGDTTDFFTWGENVFSWYPSTTGSTETSLNAAGHLYGYIAIG